MSENNEQLEALRGQIDALDIELIDVLSRRFAVVRAVGHLKAGTDGLSVVQAKRAELVVQRAMEMASEKNVNPLFVKMLYEAMIDEAHVIEHEIVEDAAAR